MHLLLIGWSVRDSGSIHFVVSSSVLISSWLLCLSIILSFELSPFIIAWCGDDSFDGCGMRWMKMIIIYYFVLLYRCWQLYQIKWYKIQWSVFVPIAMIAIGTIKSESEGKYRLSNQINNNVRATRSTHNNSLPLSADACQSLLR
jgi:hypothetical protein